MATITFDFTQYREDADKCYIKIDARGLTPGIGISIQNAIGAMTSQDTIGGDNEASSNHIHNMCKKGTSSETIELKYNEGYSHQSSREVIQFMGAAIHCGVEVILLINDDKTRMRDITQNVHTMRYFASEGHVLPDESYRFVKQSPGVYLWA